LGKLEVRSIAEAQGFCNSEKPDSQDICFISDGDYVAFFEQYTGKPYPTGDILDLSGQVIGQHRGAVRYTAGQRKGLGLALNKPVYVCRKDMTANTVTVGPEQSLYSQELWADDVNWIATDHLSGPMRVYAKIRYRQTEQPSTVYPDKSGKIRLLFDKPQRAVTAGQAAVLYNGDIVVGGGTILKTVQF
jgi:tRNA-specific 2-thiouridylase